MIALDPSQLHDATLEQVNVDWRSGMTNLHVKLSSAAPPNCAYADIMFEGVSMIVCPRRMPWGRNYQINVITITAREDNSQIIQIEMQSGDIIVIECARSIWLAA